MTGLFERVVSEGGVLLKVDAFGAGEGGAAQLLQLTFDLGRIGVSADPADGGTLSIRQLQIDEPGGVSLVEDEPWWRLLGSPLSGVSPSRGSDGAPEMRLQFRPDDENPRFVRLRAAGDSVRALLEPVTGGPDV